MKTTIHIIIILLLSAGSLMAEKNEDTEKLLCNDLNITVINESNIYLGEYYPGSDEQLNSKKFEFRIDGDRYRCFSWEINDLIDNDVNFTLKFFGSPNGTSWSEVTRCGSNKLNSCGNYYLKIVLIRLIVDADAKEDDDVNNFFTVSVEY